MAPGEISLTLLAIRQREGGLFCFACLFVLYFDLSREVDRSSISCLSVHWLEGSQELGLILDLL